MIIMKEDGEQVKIGSNEIWAVAIMGIAVFLLVSAITFNPANFPLAEYYKGQSRTADRNYVGIVGTYASGTLILLFGLGTYILVGILGTLGWHKFKEKKIKRAHIIGFMILLVVSCTFLDNIRAMWYILFMGWGGITGGFLNDLVSAYLGKVGSFIVLGILLLVSILLVTEVSLKTIMSGRKKAKFPVITAGNIAADQTKLLKPASQTATEKAGKSALKPEEVPVIVGPVEKRKKPVHARFEFMDELYEPPPVNLLVEPKASIGVAEEALHESARILEETLNNFGVIAKVTQISKGPVITRFELQPAPGVKVSSITNLSNDLALSLAVPSVRLEAPVPGKAVVGIEIPNKNPEIVLIRSVLEHETYGQAKSPLIFCLGKNVEGTPLVADLEDMPHLLVAGATGSGKSVFIYSLITSFLYRNGPADLRFVMIDPKMVELSAFEGIPHLILPVIKDSREAGSAMKWVVNEMETRYDSFLHKGVHSLKDYNQTKPRLPYLVVIIDELADLMIVAPLEVEDRLCRLAQMGRAVGIHLVLATQRPSVDIITGLIKANFPSRISFAVSSLVDSRTILDISGAEKLLGKGDMLFSQTGSVKPQRIQGVYVSRQEVNKIVGYLKDKYGTPELTVREVFEEAKEEMAEDDDDDLLFNEAIKVVIRHKQASTSLLQRRLKIGYNRAARIIDAMQEKGIIGPQDGTKPRDMLVDESYLDKLK